MRARQAPSLAALLLVALPLAGCRKSLPATDCTASPPTAPGQSVCTVPGWDNRAFILHLPPSFDGKTKLPLVVALHGGGGRKEGMNPLTCEDGDESKPSCLFSGADERGMILVVPDGTESKLNARTWNAGGGADGTTCLDACQKGVDDIAYVHDLLDEVRALVPVDDARVFFTGFSDGASMSNRIACEMADQVSAIAPVGGANQFAFGGGTCAPSRPVAVLHTHGEADPCWPFTGGHGTCPGQPEGTYADVQGSVVGTADHPGWARRNGCAMVDAPAMEALPDGADDGTSAIEARFSGCEADVRLIKVMGAGHTWPGGNQYLGETIVGKVSRDFSATEVVLDFFAAQPPR
ncbi:MAG: PHB depolymerase family esterase [Byssovorax sp.]